MPVPAWLQQRLEAAGGSVPFARYMDWALHDPEHGAYGAGRLRIGRHGDFATAPSLGADFAGLLAAQVAQWLKELALDPPTQDTSSQEIGSSRLSLIETGPGEGDLAGQLAAALVDGWPLLAACTELVLVEPNAGMAARQRQRLEDCPLPVRWSSFEELAARPLRGVVLAHEVLDALAVERIVSSGAGWRQQLVTLQQGTLRLEPGGPLEPAAAARLQPLGLQPPGEQRPPGWCTELHPGLEPWLAACGAALRCGRLLVVDYALEAWRYYAPQRSNGTLMAYRGQQASSDPLADPGHWDLTAHLCIDSLVAAASASGWQLLGQCRQGEALLALGLAERLHGLQHQGGAGLGELLARREALLRLVDPAALGDFRWLAFARGESGADQAQPRSGDTPLFLAEPA
ncbi:MULTISPECIES: class I SAM-dependent methyltransferase [Synechococcaceae]|uniref:class I SAM-dependent methyltransferase n=1 Tax=Synechococcaceae TaxID=1890426 RepID=UPI0008FF2965|nr:MULTISPECIES: SAM-dependent methyltransferase [Synechococcaceae]APD47240.1 SAM-dependent methyltransferase [Synechococcus sp. SynAce01]MCT4365060.1 SAM-dependent methyltransferase [Candidatus Regnicoccus frigidus MAG-AL1]MCT4367786.1 SAM-dependent methyltransferase [Candidatus Regnicoccus frigidus MAG-AL2]TWB88648.1 SAM-dependent MidA family methyltransferase [Synechococcus sp. Ace-Pa]